MACRELPTASRWFLFGLIVFSIVLVSAGCGGGGGEGAGKGAVDASALEDLVAAGAFPDDVLKVLGSPDDAQMTGPEYLVWVYYSSPPAEHAGYQLVFSNGQAVAFQLVPGASP